MNEVHAGQSVAINGIALHYELHGDGDPLLLLHGMTGCAGDWHHAGRDRFAETYRLIAVDARGHVRRPPAIIQPLGTNVAPNPETDREAESEPDVGF